jgi:general secretion pathway protein L
MSTTDWLLLRMPAGGADLSWAVADGTGQLLAPPAADDTANLATLAAGRHVALLVPGTDVSLFQISLPAGNEARLLQLAPFALEDQVSQDIEQLHFAVGEHDAASGLVPVAVVERAQMQEWLARAAALSLVPHAVFAENDLAPVLPGHVTMVVAGGQLVLRNGEARPLLLPADDPALAIDMLLAGTDPATVNLAVYSTPEEWHLHGTAIEALRSRFASMKVQLNAGGLLAMYALTVSQAQPINLLQGTFRPQRTSAAAWQQWRSVAMLAGALVLLHGLGTFWQLRQLQQAADETSAEMTKRYSALYPGQNPGENPRRNLEKRLSMLAGGANQQGELLHLLAAVAAAKQNVPQALLQSFVFEPGSLNMKLRAPDAATLEQFNQALRGSGYKAEVGASSMRDGKFEGQVLLKGAGS